MKVYNPYTNQPVGEVQLDTIPIISNKIELAKKAKTSMRLLSGFERASILNHIVLQIEERKAEFIHVLTSESAKPYKYAKGEVERAIETFRIASEECTRLPQEIFDLDRSAKGRNLVGEYRYFPVGVVFGISPFNFPLNLAVHKIAPAIATGCPIILKPSSKTPLTMELLKRIIDKTDMPSGAFQLIHCSREDGNHLIGHPDINLLSFTGSPDVGWEMKKKAHKQKVVLELGGNAAAIICSDAVVEDAINELIIGAFAYSGQVCIHTQRIYVHHSIRKGFEELFLQKTASLKIDSPEHQDTDFSVLIDEQNAIRVEEWINEAIQAGAKLICGGKREGNLLAPTILTNVPKGCKVLEEEVFGPVVILESFNNLDEAIEKVNDSRWGLQASIFTDSYKNLSLAYEKLHFGGVIHNLATTFRVDNMPYGGIKDSGFGREGVKYAMLDYLEGKLLVRKS